MGDKQLSTISVSRLLRLVATGESTSDLIEGFRPAVSVAAAG